MFIYVVISDVTDPSPSVTVLIRGTAGRHAWTMQLIHQPRGARANQRVRSQRRVRRHKKARYGIRQISLSVLTLLAHLLARSLHSVHSRRLYPRVAQRPTMLWELSTM